MGLPKGRLFETVSDLFEKGGMGFSFENRKLMAKDATGTLNIFLVKNADLPTYVNYGIAGLGICGEDVIYESGYRFYKLLSFPFGSTKMCLAAKKGYTLEDSRKQVKVATKFPRFTRTYFHAQGIPVEIIKLNGSVELGPITGLAPYIVDLVETGSTLKANNLEIIEELADIQVYMIANPSYYKLHYQEINRLTEWIKKELG